MTYATCIQTLGLDIHHPRVQDILAQNPTFCPTVDLRDDIALALDNMSVEETLQERILAGTSSLGYHPLCPMVHSRTRASIGVVGETNPHQSG
jgi:hypothetical protein